MQEHGGQQRQLTAGAGGGGGAHRRSSKVRRTLPRISRAEASAAAAAGAIGAAPRAPLCEPATANGASRSTLACMRTSTGREPAAVHHPQQRIPGFQRSHQAHMCLQLQLVGYASMLPGASCSCLRCARIRLPVPRLASHRGAAQYPPPRTDRDTSAACACRTCHAGAEPQTRPPPPTPARSKKRVTDKIKK